MEANQRNLEDVTFIIPYYKDSKEREENLICILNYLQGNFNTNIIIEERGDTPNYMMRLAKAHYYEQIHDAIFHRTAVINAGIKKSKTRYIAVYDTDVIFDIENIVKAVKLLRSGLTLVYPYSGEFVDINRTYIKDGVIIERESFAKGSVGGACFLNVEDYWKCGLENENYYRHCPDDVDRHHRVLTLGYGVARVDGKCWHISHPPSANSGVNVHTEHNNLEWMRIKAMNKEQLTEYIKNWLWSKKT